MHTAQTSLNAQQSCEIIKQTLSERQVPQIAILLGSGWGKVRSCLTNLQVIPYSKLPGFPELSVAGHAGEVVIGDLQGVPVLLLAGRKHTYEGGDPAAMCGVIATLAKLGVQVLVQTNAAGSLRHQLPSGSVMMISDHYNNTGLSPLIGLPGNERFVGLRNAYDPVLRTQVQEAFSGSGQSLLEGIYVWNLGPQFETPAEVWDLSKRGFSAVGMSTVPETILARYHKIRVLGLSLMVNMAEGMSETEESPSHEQTLTAASTSEAKAAEILTTVVLALRL